MKSLRQIFLVLSKPIRNAIMTRRVLALLHHSITVELGDNTKAPTRILVREALARAVVSISFARPEGD
jgi:hypothetical protein